MKINFKVLNLHFTMFIYATVFTINAEKNLDGNLDENTVTILEVEKDLDGNLDENTVTILEAISESLSDISISGMGGKKAFGQCTGSGKWVYEPYGLGAFMIPTKDMKELFTLLSKKCPTPKKGRPGYPEQPPLKRFFVA